MGHHLDAHTFPELLGRRFNSKFIQVFSGLIIFLFIPLYAAAVLLGGCEFIHAEFNVSFEMALLVFSIIIAIYVIFGGLKGVMYTDALQGSIMVVAMLILVGATYFSLGGIASAHQSLTNLADLVPAKLQAIGHRGWTAFPEFGFGELKYNLWWIMVSTIMLGVGIGVLAQPQLAVRFMTVKSRRELNRAVLLGGLFILAIPGSAYVVGSLSNVWFTQNGPEISGRVSNVINAETGHAMIEWTVTDAEGKETLKQAPVAISEGKAVLGESVKGRTISIENAKGITDQIIPQFINQAMPKWFRLLFLLTLLAAAMSTLSSQFHTLGTAISRDVYGQLQPKGGQGIGVTRLGILIGIILAVTISFYARGGSMFIARATAIFFGLCVSTFLPAYLGGLFTRWVSRPAAIASMVVGFLATAFWLTFVKSAEASAIGLVQKVTHGKTSILESHLNWPVVDPIVIALPLSIITIVIFSLIFRPKDELKALEDMPSS
jgi:SSS family solute:Na+ symporter